jgi:hypothetical protein
MRADFFGRCAAMPLHAPAGGTVVLLMDEDDLRRTMIQPAELAGLGSRRASWTRSSTTWARA